MKEMSASYQAVGDSGLSTSETSMVQPSHPVGRATRRRSSRGLAVGRPVTTMDSRRVLNLARDRARLHVAQVLEFLVRLVTDSEFAGSQGATAKDRLRAAENLLDRLGMPRLHQSESTEARIQLTGDDIAGAIESARSVRTEAIADARDWASKEE